MYKVRNRSLDAVFKKYGVSSVYDLNMDQLEEICLDKRIPPKMKKNDRNETVGMDRYATAQIIEAEHTFSEYMGELHWTQEDRDMANEGELLEKIKGDTTGFSTFEKYAQFKLGIHNLRPGQAAEVRWNRRWLEEVLKTKPVYEHLEITDLETQSIINPLPEEIEEKSQSSGLSQVDIENLSEIDLEKMEYSTLRKLAKEKGVKTFARKKEEWLPELKELFAV